MGQRSTHNDHHHQQQEEGRSCMYMAGLGREGARRVDDWWVRSKHGDDDDGGLEERGARLFIIR